MDIPILLTTYNRPQALLRTLGSLSKTDTRYGKFRLHLVICDDGSNEETLKIIRDRRFWDVYDSVMVGEMRKDSYGGEPNRARRRSLKTVFEPMPENWKSLSTGPYRHPLLEHADFDFVLTVESDLVFDPRWLVETVKAYLLQSQLTDEPIATVSPYHGAFHAKREQKFDSFALRDSTGGVCHLITRDWYNRGKEPQGWMAWDRRSEDGDWPEGCGGWDSMMSVQAKHLGYKFMSLIPSYVDHVPGKEGSTSGSSLWNDRAVDFVGEVTY